ncbi:GPN-loop GTPase 3-like [Homarus americanus]|uniref:GPN-loop GTPase 3-like n=1 Tax=Homarus americanus TaxID=6706 RepID=UPI001C46B13D|nr:GPN-loop GTPase 3-like [Homarus americanus]XP_042238513.1 GPN-loop GTPase 3-like [Homarus americanus]
MRFCQLVLGPAGSGKSTYCAALQRHAETINRSMHIVNLDPAAEAFTYEPIVDVRDLIQVDDVMQADDMDFGPNGGLVFCMEYLVELDGLDWLKEQLGDYDDDCILFDCPGQIELYTHMDVMKRLVYHLQSMDFRVCAVFVLDSVYMVDSAKFLSGSLAALATMVQLEVPHINILTKMDLLNKSAREQLEMFLEPEIHELLASEHSVSRFNKRYHKLTSALGQVLEDFSLVRYVPLNINSEESLMDVLIQTDFAVQYGEDQDVKTQDFEYPDAEDEEQEPSFNF